MQQIINDNWKGLSPADKANMASQLFSQIGGTVPSDTIQTPDGSPSGVSKRITRKAHG